MANILSLGSALHDIYLIDRDDFAATELNGESLFSQLVIGTKVDIDRVRYEIGGGGTNAAVAFARHGHETAFIGNIGRDTAGETVITTLEREKVNTSFVTTLPRKNTGCSVILLDRHTGERTILTCRGASAHFDNLDDHVITDMKPDWLYATTLRGDFDTLTRFFKTAHKSRCKVMFNPGSLELAKPALLTKLLKYVDILLLNEHEARQPLYPATKTAQKSPSTAPNPAKTALKTAKSAPAPPKPLKSAQPPQNSLLDLAIALYTKVPTVIITAGQSGAIATNGRTTYRLGLYEDAPVKDTTGAGDAFGSGFLAHFAAGYSFRSSLIFASANSTSVVTKLGAKRGLLTGVEKLHKMSIKLL